MTLRRRALAAALSLVACAGPPVAEQTSAPGPATPPAPSPPAASPVAAATPTAAVAKLDTRFGFVLGRSIRTETGEARGTLDAVPSAISPSGRYAAIWTPPGVRRELRVVDVTSGTARTLITVPDTERGEDVLWASDETAVAAIVYSQTGFGLVAFAPTYAAVRSIDLRSGLAREVYRAATNLRGVGWNRQAGVLALAAYPTSSFGLGYHVVPDGAASFVRSFEDVCTVRGDAAAATAFLVSPQCFNIGAHVPSDRLTLMPLADPASARIVTLAPDELLLAAAFRPTSKDVIVLIGLADRRSMRLELWPDGNERSRKTVWSGATPVFDETHVGRALRVRPDGTAALMDLGGGPGGFVLVALPGGTALSVVLDAFPDAWVTVDATTAERLQPR